MQYLQFSKLIASLCIIACGASTATAGPFTNVGHDPVTMTAWATDFEDASPGPVDIAMPELGLAAFGAPENALGPATGDNSDVFSLGDGGSVTLYFESGIEDGPGDDFAVYENGFFILAGLFAEFAFVEVSTNGVDFARFATTTLHNSPVASGEVVDPSDFQNFAGDQPLNLGTGFDLAELASDPITIAGLLDLGDVRYVRLVDVVGDGSTLDETGQPIYDPYPTAFPSGGFDVDAVGVLYVVPEADSLGMLAGGLAGLVVLTRRRFSSRRCIFDS